MNASWATRLGNFLWYQSIWFIAVLAGPRFGWLLLTLILGHLALARDRRREIAVVCACGSLGIAADTILTISGFYHFEPVPQGLPIPFWLAAIWFGFAGTLRGSLSFMVARPYLMTVAAIVAAPANYLAGMRFGAVSFPLGIWPTLGAVGVTWAVLIPLFVALCAMIEHSPVSSADPLVPNRS